MVLPSVCARTLPLSRQLEWWALWSCYSEHTAHTTLGSWSLGSQIHAAPACMQQVATSACSVSRVTCTHTCRVGYKKRWPEATWHHEEGILTSHRLLIAKSFTQSLSPKHQVDLYVCTSFLMFNYLKHSNIHTALERNQFSLCSELWMHVFHNQPKRPDIGEVYIWEAHERPSHRKLFCKASQAQLQVSFLHLHAGKLDWCFQFLRY